jgi:hypothetical protein
MVPEPISTAYFTNPSHRIVGGGVQAGSTSARRPLNGLLYLPRMIMMMEKLVEWRLAGETEVLGENLPQRHFVHHKSHLKSFPSVCVSVYVSTCHC